VLRVVVTKCCPVSVTGSLALVDVTVECWRCSAVFGAGLLWVMPATCVLVNVTVERRKRESVLGVAAPIFLELLCCFWCGRSGALEALVCFRCRSGLGRVCPAKTLEVLVRFWCGLRGCPTREAVRIGSLTGPLVPDAVLKRAYALSRTWCGTVLRRVHLVSEVKV
jgi:hypothetical protein